MFVYKSRFLTRGEVWYDDQPNGVRVDWIHHRQRSTPLPNGRSKPFHTVLIELQKTPVELLASIDPKTARKITDAQEKDKLRYERCDSRDSKIMDEVEAMWNETASAQKKPLLEREWMEPFRQYGPLDITVARDSAGQVLVYHLVFLTPKRARQLIAIAPYKASPDIAWRNAVSRANCLVHWQNFLRYSEQGILHFDFGGWYPGNTDIQLLGINAFKKSFGGSVVQEFDCEEPVTVKGRIGLTLVQILARFKPAGHLASPNSKRVRNENEPKEHTVSPAFR